MANKSVTLDILGRNADAILKIEQIKKDYAELKAEVDAGRLDLTPRQLSAAYQSSLRSVAKDLFDVKKNADDANKSTGGFLNTLKRLPSMLGSFLTDFSNKMPALGFGGPAIPWQAALPLIGGMVAGVGALLVEADGLLAGFSAAGMGAGAFAALAMPAIKQVENGYTSLSTAQTAYNTALAKENADPTKSNLTALKTAALNLQLAKNALKGAEGPAASGIAQLVSSFDKISNNFKPEVFKVITAFLGVANNILPTLTPFATTFADALTKWGQGLANDTKLPGVLSNAQVPGKLGGEDKQLATNPPLTPWQNFLKTMQGIEQVALPAIFKGFNQVAGALAGLLTIMSKKDIVNSINIAFTVIADTLKGLGAAIKYIMFTWDSWVQSFDLGRHAIASAFDGLRHTFAMAGHDIAGVFDNLRHTNADMAHNMAVVFDELRHTVMSEFHDIAVVFDETRGHFHQMYSDVVNTGGRLISWFGQLPGRIKNIFASAGSWLYNAGRNVVIGFWNGIVSLAGWLSGAISNFFGSLIPGWAKSALGINSPSRVFMEHGKSIVEGLALGISGNHGLAQTAIRSLVQTTVNASRANFPGVAGGNGALQIQWVGGTGADAQFIAWLKENIRIRGGNPAVLGR
jgi:hypothetical protein